MSNFVPDLSPGERHLAGNGWRPAPVRVKARRRVAAEGDAEPELRDVERDDGQDQFLADVEKLAQTVECLDRPPLAAPDSFGFETEPLLGGGQRQPGVGDLAGRDA